MWHLVGTWIARRPASIVFIWAMAVAVVAWQVATRPPPQVGDLGSFLPPDVPHAVAQSRLREAFPEIASRSQIVVVIQRQTGLTSGDLDWLCGLADQIRPLVGGMVLSPAMPFFDHRLRSEDGRSAMLVANLNTSFIGEATSRTVDAVEPLLGADRPDGLEVEMTGTATIGRDYARAAKKAAHRTTWVTIIAVLVILVFVYRSPVGALVPLVSIGASAYLAFAVLDGLARLGCIVTDIERIFTIVLVFGAGVDFALFWISRYRESLEGQADLGRAALSATVQTGPAIVASAATTICGLSMLMLAELVPSHNAGRVLPPALVLAMLAGLTLAPAMARLMGTVLFWPLGMQARPRWSQRILWPRVAAGLTARPAPVMVIGLVILGLPALYALRLPQRYDSLSELPPGTTSYRGYYMLKRHFSAGQLFSTQLLVELPEDRDSPAIRSAISTALGRRIQEVEGVEDVYSLTAPLGTARTGARLANPLVRPVAQRFYSSQALPVVRLEILTVHPPFSFEAMETSRRIREAAEACLAETMSATAPAQAAQAGSSALSGRVLMTGLTPYIMDVRTVSRGDQIRVMTLATVVVALVVFALVRDPLLTFFMVLATWLTYGATLTISSGLMSWLTGMVGLDWKVSLIVFVIVVAVGQDYNIFLVSRLLSELSGAEAVEATRRAVVRTGSVISNCGLIMAATLGSLWAGGLSLLQQVGLALALGILIDTFLVRPVLLPSFFLVAYRCGLILRRSGKLVV